MQKKLLVLFLLVLAAFVLLGVRIYSINRDNGEEYKKTVLSQQSYDSRVIDYKRGSITDCKGTILADSVLVYDVVVDAKQILAEDYYLEPTLSMLAELGVDTEKVRAYIQDNPNSQYYVVLKNLSYNDKTAYDKELADGKAEEERQGIDVKERKYSNVKGIWFDANYIRTYPNGSLACDVIGFTNGSNSGSFGLEEYYNTTLNGTPGREYGYLDDNSNLERTTIDATDGNNLQLTIDANVQSIVEKYLKKFNDDNADVVHNGNGANNVGCIVMNVNTGEIVAMASYPEYDLNDPYDTSALVGMPKLDDSDEATDEYLTQEDVDALSQEDQTRYLNALWRNYCISSVYEPGSVAKPFTVAAGLETGCLTGNETYNCTGSLDVGGWTIKCHNVYGDGLLTVGGAIERSCNVALMEMALATGVDNFTTFQDIFNFGLKTNIDLAGEARTDSFVYKADTMGITDLATNSFGQNFSVTMIQMAAGFASLINGGYYYEPHVVSKITNSTGATIKNIEPRLLKQTISEETSEKIRSYCLQVVTGENGTGKTARPAGYMIGGKTGTAETIPRGMGEYVVSFMGYAPADDPQYLIYVVVDRPNNDYQADAKFATGIVRNVLTEALPYLNVYMTEPLSESEQAELAELELQQTTAVTDETTEGGDETAAEGEEGTVDASSAEQADSSQDAAAAEAEEDTEPAWKSFELDPETGYLIDPSNGHHIDPETGYDYDSSFDSESSSGSSSTGSVVEPIPADETAGGQ